MLDAIMEYTSASHLPTVFSDNAGLPVNRADNLPSRMEGNQLHRYSKVLDNNIGEVHFSTRVLPPCPRLKWAHPHPLNRTAPTNLYKTQKLLSLNLDTIPFPIQRENIKITNFGEVEDWMGVQDTTVFGTDDMMTWSMAWLFLLLCLVCYVSYRYCKARYCLRRRKPKMRRLLSAVSGPRNV